MHLLRLGSTMRRSVALFLLAIAGTSCEKTSRPGRDPLDPIVDRFLAAARGLEPEWATSLGLHDADPHHTPVTAESYRARRDTAAALLAALHEIDTTRLEPERRIDARVLEAELRSTLRDFERREWTRSPQLYIRFGGVHDLLVGEWAPAEERFRNAAHRLHRIPDALAAGRAQLESPPRLWTEMAEQTSRSVVRFLRQELPARAGELPAGLRDTVQRAADDAARALDAYAAFLRDTLAPRATGDWAVGAEHYNELLRDVHFLDLDADALIALGERWMAETEAALAALADSIAPGRTWRALTEEAKSRHPGAAPGEVRAAYEAEMRRALGLIRERDLFEIPPGERLRMIDTPPTLRTTYPYGGYDAPAPFDSVRVGRFFVTPVEPEWTPEQVEAKLRGHNHGWITVVALHEAYPGHHLQYVKAFEHPGIVRKLFSNSYFTEGWALYAEHLMGREGFYTTPDARLTQLRMRLWRAARVVIDPSIHTGRMTYDEAVRYLVERVGLEEPDARGEVNRYTTWPTQAPSYLVGMMEIVRIRDAFRESMGAVYTDKRFHEALLAGGSLPIALARRSLELRR